MMLIATPRRASFSRYREDAARSSSSSELFEEDDAASFHTQLHDVIGAFQPAPSIHSLDTAVRSSSDTLAHVGASNALPSRFSHVFSSRARQVFYQIFDGDELRSCQTALDPDNETMGCLILHHVSPPHTILSIKRIITRIESLGSSVEIEAFADEDSPLALGDEEPLDLNLAGGPGSDESRPLMLVLYRDAQKELPDLPTPTRASANLDDSSTHSFPPPSFTASHRSGPAPSPSLTLDSFVFPSSSDGIEPESFIEITSDTDSVNPRPVSPSESSKAPSPPRTPTSSSFSFASFLRRSRGKSTPKSPPRHLSHPSSPPSTLHPTPHPAPPSPLLSSSRPSLFSVQSDQAPSLSAPPSQSEIELRPASPASVPVSASINTERASTKSGSTSSSSSSVKGVRPPNWATAKVKRGFPVYFKSSLVENALPSLPDMLSSGTLLFVGPRDHDHRGSTWKEAINPKTLERGFIEWKISYHKQCKIIEKASTW